MQLPHYQPDRYQSLFAEKIAQAHTTLALQDAPETELSIVAQWFPSEGRFRIWHDGDSLNYVMFPPGDSRNPQGRTPFRSPRRALQTRCLCSRPTSQTPRAQAETFQVEFLSTLSGELLITLIYHRPLTEAWNECAAGLASTSVAN